MRYYGQWMRDEAEKRIGDLYPKVKAWRDPKSGRYFGEAEVGEWRELGNRREELGNRRREAEEVAKACGYSSISQFLSSISCEELTVIAWLWARTVKSPNPAFADVDVPLASTFMLSTKKGKEAYVEPVIEGGNYRFAVKVGKPKDPAAAKAGTKLSRGANFKCIMSGEPMSPDYIKSEGRAGRMGARLMAIVAEGERGRVYLSPTPEHEAIAKQAKPAWKPETALPDDPRNFWTLLYGLTTYGDLFTPRQLVALTTFSDLVGEAMERVRADALAAGLPDDPTPLRDGGSGATAYAQAVAVYLGCALDKASDFWSSLVTWMNDRGALQQTFGRQALPMVWDFSEANPFSSSGGNFLLFIRRGSDSVVFAPARPGGQAVQQDATMQSLSEGKVVSTDPPYYDNVGYADLSDFFYVWIRRTLHAVYPQLFATVAVPKVEELVATPYRHGGKEDAELFFLAGMTKAVWRLAVQAHAAFPVTIYYAFKQAERKSDRDTTSTGWETFLSAIISTGLRITGTWPVRTESPGRGNARGTNALASSIVLVCRKRPEDAPTATRREFVATLKKELPEALVELQKANIAPVDLAQAAIGPGMAVFTRYKQVLDAEGQPVSVREALALINQVLDEALAEQEGDFDADTRWALAWFDQQGFDEGEYGVAETLSKAKNTSIEGMVQAGILQSRRGKVRLLKPDDLPDDWDPDTDSRLTHWEVVHHLIRVLETGGEAAAAELVRRLGSRAETARELAYRLYTVCERRKRAAEALRYNALVQSFPEIVRLSREAATAAQTQQQELFAETEE